MEIVNNKAVPREEDCLRVHLERATDKKERLGRPPAPARHGPQVRTVHGAAETA